MGSNPASPKREYASSDGGGSASTGSFNLAAAHAKGQAPHTITEVELLEPPVNFAMIEDGLYRSGLPTARSFGFVRRLQLRTILILSYEKPNPALLTFLRREGVQVVHIDMYNKQKQTSVNGMWKPLSEQVIKETIELILNLSFYPILVVDTNGIYHVGIIIGCLRRMQRWNLNSIINEYRSFLNNNLKNNKYITSRYINEQFIELFDTDLINIPDHIPPWFNNYITMHTVERNHLRMLIQSNKVDDCNTLIETPPSSPPPPTSSTDNAAPDQQEPSEQSDDVTHASPFPNSANSLATTPKYMVYYFSAACPLNSDVDTFQKKPRIQTL